MDARSKQKVLEALQMQPLSEEEKASRHILARLYGPIATCKEKTRNGRGYNKELWEKALADDLFKEKLATKSLFLELGHPTDREETDMKCVCACIPEMPKIVNDDLYAYVDILDTPNGKLLKTLCDYGFIPGISSRGSGDIMANDEVDPETFFLETWDIVQLPAVKKARLAMCESYSGKKSLRTALQESYDAAKDEDKKVMKESLENLDININEALTEAETLPGGTPADPEEVPNIPNDLMIEEANEEEIVDETPIEEEPVEDEPVEDEGEEEVGAYTIGDMIKELGDYDNELSLEFKPIVIDDKEYEIQALSFDPSEEGKVIAEVHYASKEADDTNDELPEDENPQVDIEVDSNAEEPDREPEGAEGEAGDAGDDEVIESLKEAVRRQNELENEVKSLKEEKTVSDAEVQNLKEELNKYKTAFVRVSEVAAKSNKFEAENKSLKEQLEGNKIKIEKLESEVNAKVSLTESIDESANKIKVLTEKLNKAYSDAEENEKGLNEQLTRCQNQLAESTKLVKAYKAKTAAVLNHYIESKADMLGVRTNDIISRLNENYSLADIYKVCEDLLTSTTTYGSLPFGNNVRMRVKESVNNKSTTRQPVDPDNGYEIDDSLLELAGLKK